MDQRDTAPRLHGRILVVDDEPDIVTILTKYFTDVGLSVDAASHGGDALIAVSQYRPETFREAVGKIRSVLDTK